MITPLPFIRWRLPRTRLTRHQAQSLGALFAAFALSVGGGMAIDFARSMQLAKQARMESLLARDTARALRQTVGNCARNGDCMASGGVPRLNLSLLGPNGVDCYAKACEFVQTLRAADGSPATLRSTVSIQADGQILLTLSKTSKSEPPMVASERFRPIFTPDAALQWSAEPVGGSTQPFGDLAKDGF